MGVMRFGNRRKLIMRYIRPFEVLQRVGEVVYELSLPPSLSGIHSIFHVFMLKKYHADNSYVIQWDSILLDQNLEFEEESVTILDKQVRKLRSKDIASVKVQWKHRPIAEMTYEKESDMRSRYPDLFTRPGVGL
ncbi:hypothetical protein K7X08_028626 [Anisodus acutangulus]|uniref:Tf2-1-like SH3-like domain-containing protein n=1 Tax=Anisodus acutangulus TaxID=402998 RepID=A0A9Q1R9B6_9SOLA|nr:hypothetical protein K7X08_028626 [Anisodus acutangulus]